MSSLAQFVLRGKAKTGTEATRRVQRVRALRAQAHRAPGRSMGREPWPRRLDGGDIDLRHLHHRFASALGGRAIQRAACSAAPSYQRQIVRLRGMLVARSMPSRAKSRPMGTPRNCLNRNAAPVFTSPGEKLAWMSFTFGGFSSVPVDPREYAARANLEKTCQAQTSTLPHPPQERLPGDNHA